MAIPRSWALYLVHERHEPDLNGLWTVVRGPERLAYRGAGSLRVPRSKMGRRP